MSLRDATVDVLAKVLNGTHKAVLKVSRGRYGSRLYGMTSVELHTTGRKSGQRRSAMLTSPICEDDRIVLIASKGGDDRHPDWYRNLTANPEVEITEGDDTKPYRARTASPEEKAELWPQVTAAYKGYAGYQKRTGRDIPVVICEPR
jgi:deazaflavin-dependent oxidoreductase (nitroreductase family)